MEWWIWVLAGFALLAFEMVSPGGFYVFFFGSGALAVGLLGRSRRRQDALASGRAVRSPVRGVTAVLSPPDTEQDAGACASVERLTASWGQVPSRKAKLVRGGRGKAELRGSTWNARNAGETTIGRDQSCVVERVDGLTLWVSAD